MAFMGNTNHEAFIHASPPYHNTTSSEWGPYSGPGNFSANMMITLVVLFSALILGLAINFFIRFLLCSSRLGHSHDPEKHPPSPSPTDSLPTLVFSAGTKLAGAEAECAICLAEFAEGDTVRVMPACNNGFHVRCIQRWLASHLSCPTCRTKCVAPAAPPPGVSRVEGAGNLNILGHVCGVC